MSTRILEIDPVVTEYLQFLELERGLAPNSVNAYRRDIVEFKKKLKLTKSFDISHRNVTQYITDLNAVSRRPSSIAMARFYRSPQAWQKRVVPDAPTSRCAWPGVV